MPIKFTLKVSRVGNSHRITLPKEVREAVDLQEGDLVQMWTTDHRIIIEKFAEKKV